MITSFGNRVSKEIWEENKSKGLPRHLWLRAKALMTIMYNTDTIEDLRIQGQPPNIRLHKLKGNLKDHWSVTISLPWCLIFQFKNGNFSDVQIVDYH